MPPALTARLVEIEARFESVSEELVSGSSPGSLARLGREHHRLSRLVNIIGEWRSLQEDAEVYEELIAECDDAGERAVLEKEHRDAVAEFEESTQDLMVELLPRDESDDRNAIIEVRAGTGGDEASLFAADLFRMYHQFADGKGWTFDVLTEAESAVAGGIREGVACISGDAAFGVLKYERGVHRVQRVPVTESAGRVHTSTATVAVLPEAEEVDLDIRQSDLQIDTFRASGAGGQHVNTTDSAVRITHVPTGTVVSIQDERSQHSNKLKAMQVLRSRIYEAQQEKLRRERSDARKAQIGSGDRSERIRTYNFPQDRITDHRIGLSKHGMSNMLQGDLLEEFVDALDAAWQLEALEGLREE